MEIIQAKTERRKGDLTESAMFPSSERFRLHAEIKKTPNKKVGPWQRKEEGGTLKNGGDSGEVGVEYVKFARPQCRRKRKISFIRRSRR